MLGASVGFSTMAALSHAAAKAGCDWRLVTFARAGLMLILAAAMLRMGGVRFFFFRSPLLLFRSVIGTVALLCSFYALTHMPIADSVTIQHMFAVWVTLLSWPLLKERPSVKAWGAIVLSAVGVFLIAQPHFAEGSLVALVALLSSFFGALALISIHKLRHLDSRLIVTHFAIVSTAATGGFFLLSGSVTQIGGMLDLHSSLMLLGVGLLGTMSQIMMTVAFRRGKPSRVAVVALTQIIFTFVYDRLFWGDRPFNVWSVVGMILVAAPTAWLLSGIGAQVKDRTHTLGR